jgi:general secretion pathway protein D
MQLYRAILWSVCLALAAACSAAADEVVFVPSPSGSLSKTRALLDAADLRVMLPMGYVLRPDLEASGTLASRRGVVESRIYIHGTGAEEGRLEVAIVPGLGGGYEFALRGGAAAEELGWRFEALVEGSQALSSGEPDLGNEMFRLGHIEADRALALLKALGYHTVEFAPSSKAKDGEPVFDMIEGKRKKLPWIIKVVNASKTSLLEGDPNAVKKSTMTKSKGAEGAPKLGGSHLHNTTTGAPQERLLLVYDRNEPEKLEQLVNLLQTQIDVPAQQIVIEALIIEVNIGELRDLGVEFSGSQKNASLGFESGDSGSGLTTFLFSRDGFTDFIDFRGKLEALQETGDAEVLSSPSVLVLNDRQARIQVGRQIPVAKTTATTGTITKGIEYFPVGIVLNLRPRINRNGSEVTMQIETIISSVSVESAARLEDVGSSEIEFSPIIDNRLVETYVRVADGTPFIIGGLLSTDRQSTRAGVPVLGTLPFLGRLFSRERVETEQREVIVVITPHIVPLEENSFSYLIPKDSDLFDRFDTQLFRNAYRVRDDDVWDLKFVEQSPALMDMMQRVRDQASEDVMLQRQEPFQSLLQGRIPGEEVLVRRMLFEIVANLDFPREVNLDQIFFFTPPADESRGQKFSDDLTLQDILPKALAEPENAVMLIYEAQPVPLPGQAFSLPLSTVRDTTVAPEGRNDLLWDMNRYDERGQAQQWTILLADEGDIERLKQALVLKSVLQLNKNLPQTLQSFRPGVQILFPTREDMSNRYHLIDRDVAQLFFETKYPYQIAEKIFNETVHQVEAGLGGER